MAFSMITAFWSKRERPIHHQDQAGTHLRIFELGPVEPADCGHDDVIEIAFAAAVSLHRVEAKLERGDVLPAVGAADCPVHRPFDRKRARLDQLGPLVDRVELREAVHASGIDRDEPFEIPVVLDR